MSLAVSTRAESWIGSAACAGVVLGWAIQQVIPNPNVVGDADGPGWLPLAAVGIAAVGLMPDGLWPWRRRPQLLLWTGLLLMVWTANGLLFDLLTAAGLIGHRSATGEIVLSTLYWPGMATRGFALAAAIILARRALARPAAQASSRPVFWYGYAAFVLALPYPILRLHWALGGMLGLTAPGAGGAGFEPLLIAIPWALAAALSLALVAPPSWMPRRLLLAAGWSATAIVATIGPSAIWAFISAWASGADTGLDGIEPWVAGLFYGSWFLWAIAGGAATRAYQLRSAPPLATTSPA